jgi:glycosyltransferase involved in cell wall biosynthesis
MKSILYLQHVGWGWIKQRPHFIAENLSHRCHVDVYTERSRHFHWSMEIDGDLDLSIHTIFGLPLRRFWLIRAINRALAKYQLGRLIENYDIVWVTHPSVFDFIQNTLPQSTCLVYDCMDDALAFPATQLDPQLMANTSHSEIELIARADHVLVSSKNLETKIVNRGGAISKIKIVNNALDWSDQRVEVASELPEAIEKAIARPGIRLLYLGTISAWFDFQLILEALNRFPQIRCFLVGPSEVSIPTHDRLHHLGAIEHSLVMPILQRADLLIMPFLLSELVLSVDPVKLYEYIASGRPTLSVAYPETEKFRDHVHLYRNRDECFDIIDRCCQGENLTLIDAHDIPQYIMKNNWESRCEGIASLVGL